MDDLVAMQEGKSAAQLQHEAGVGLAAGFAGQEIGIHVSTITEVHDEPQVVGAAGVKCDLTFQGGLHQLSVYT